MYFKKVPTHTFYCCFQLGELIFPFFFMKKLTDKQIKANNKIRKHYFSVQKKYKLHKKK